MALVSESPAVSHARSVLSPILTAQRQAVNRDRFSTFSTHSTSSNTQVHLSRPQSIAFPHFHSSLSYTLVRDFAYPSFHPLHYGPPPEQSGVSTPTSDAHRRLSDPPHAWDASKANWSASAWDAKRPPNMSFVDKDGPPWSEDEDLASPVVTSVRHKKNKSSGPAFDNWPSAADTRRNRDKVNGNGARHSSNAKAISNGAAADHKHSPLNQTDNGEDHVTTTLPNSSYGRSSMQRLADEDWDTDESRYSRDYQFTIASPDEEMHGKAVALFDFASENDNELPLVEGQVILVSYRHGQGWLVAQDPKTRESGLVPEEYVRLLRDIEGGWNGLMNGDGKEGGAAVAEPESAEAKTPTQESSMAQSLGAALAATTTPAVKVSTDTPKAPAQQPDPTPAPVSAPTPAPTPTSATAPGRRPSTQHYTPVVSTFSTSREDLERFPTHKLTSPLATPTELTRPRLLLDDLRVKGVDEQLAEHAAEPA
jgi:hypothetical protein